MVGLSPVTIHNIETGVTKTSAYNFCQIAEALEVSMLSLVYDEFSEEDVILKEYFLRVVDLDESKKNLVISIR